MISRRSSQNFYRDEQPVPPAPWNPEVGAGGCSDRNRGDNKTRSRKDEDMKNYPHKVQNDIERLKDERVQQMQKIDALIADADKRMRNEEEVQKEAAKNLDMEGHKESLKRQRDAFDEINMLNARKDQLICNHYVSEAESDKVIDDLFAYEDDIAKEFDAAAAALIRKLQQIYDDYCAKVEEAESTMRRWTYEVHPNYRNFGTTYADGTNRANTPQPCRLTPYFGNALSQKVGNFLSLAKDDLKKAGSDKQ